VIVHIVMFTFKEENKEANLLKVKDALEALTDKIDELLFMEVGINFDEAKRAMDLSLYSTFDSKANLAKYAAHPEHLKVLELIKLVTVESKVVDYKL